jgi:NADH-quinone oxidoreductase subunit N
LLSLAGIPPTIGFMTKYFLFANLVNAGHIGLTIATIISSIISVGYYSYPIVVMYFRPVAAGASRPIVGLRVPVRLVVFAAETIVIVAGILPNSLMGFIMSSLGR